MNESWWLVIFLCIAIMVFGPLISLWSLNTIFNLGVEYNTHTWLAMVWINLTILGGYTRINTN